MTDVLRTVHDAVIAATDNPEEPAFVTATVKLPSDTKALAMEILEKQGTTLSAFMRECCVALVKDYQCK